VATSWQNPALRSGDVIAFPPYFTTTVLPRSDLVACEIVSATSEKFSGALVAKERDEEIEDLDLDNRGGRQSKPNATDNRHRVNIKAAVSDFFIMFMMLFANWI